MRPVEVTAATAAALVETVTREVKAEALQWLWNVDQNSVALRLALHLNRALLGETKRTGKVENSNHSSNEKKKKKKII